MGEGNIPCVMFRSCERSALTRSVVTLKSVRPAGWSVFSWNFIGIFFRLSCKRTCNKLNARTDLELSPANTMFLAGMASCGELGGDARRKR